MKKQATIDEYIQGLPERVQSVATGIRATIRLAAPNSTETIKYDIPTFQMDGLSFLYFGIWKRHIGLYPIYIGTDEFETEIREYRAKKDTVQFPLNKPVAYDLVSKIVVSQLSILVGKT
jgi:uncharacterized protein YdhG (YjbR/CyaY superfamily)